MKGVVFSMLNEMVESQFGLEVWDELLESCQLDSEGIYTAGDSYHDSELFVLVSTLSEMKGVPVDGLIEAFGEFSLTYFAEHYADFFKDHNAKSFLKSVDQLIHVEVKKLYPGAATPEFSYEDSAENQLSMTYRSPRKLYTFAKGLIKGTASYYHTNIDINMHIHEDGKDDYCRFLLTFT